MLLERGKKDRDSDARILTFDKIKNGPDLEPIVLRFDKARAVFEETKGDPIGFLKPRLVDVQRFVAGCGEMRTKELLAAIMEGLGLGLSQAEGLISSAHEVGLIEERKRGVYGTVGELLGTLPF